MFEIIKTLHVINLVIALVITYFFYKILLRTSKELYKGILYCCLAMLVIVTSNVIELFYSLEECLGGSSYVCVTEFEIMRGIIFVLLLIGSWHIYKSMDRASRELVVNGKLKIKKKK